MRKCIRCGAEMREDCAIRQSDSACGLNIVDSERFFARGIGKVRAAVCMECGEVSLYIAPDEIQKYLDKYGNM